MDPWKMTVGVQILVAICQEINSLNEVSRLIDLYLSSNFLLILDLDPVLR